MTKDNREAAAFIVHRALDLTCLSRCILRYSRVLCHTAPEGLDWD